MNFLKSVVQKFEGHLFFTLEIRALDANAGEFDGHGVELVKVSISFLLKSECDFIFFFTAIEEIFHGKKFETFDLEGPAWCKFERSGIPADYQRSCPRDVRKTWVLPELNRVHKIRQGSGPYFPLLGTVISQTFPLHTAYVLNALEYNRESIQLHCVNVFRTCASDWKIRKKSPRNQSSYGWQSLSQRHTSCKKITMIHTTWSNMTRLAMPSSVMPNKARSNIKKTILPVRKSLPARNIFSNIGSQFHSSNV